MTPLKFEFELNCLQIHLINHYPVLPLSVSLEVRPRVSHCPPQAHHLLYGLLTSHFFLLPQPVPKQTGKHAPMLHLETQNSLYSFVLSLSLICILSVPSLPLWLIYISC